MVNPELINSTVAQVAKCEAVVWDGSKYYDDAEAWTWLFWSEDHDFFKYFRQLDTKNLLELACGHGRHGEYVLSHFGDRVDRLVMLDILQSNVDFCLQRIGPRENLEIRCNSGVGFHPVADASLTAIFCYDAMVHFHHEVVKSYLTDTWRVLVPGGMALFHHSNYALEPDSPFGANPHARAYMSASLFEQYAKEAGLVVVEQKVLSWEHVPDLDCLTLIKKPTSDIL